MKVMIRCRLKELLQEKNVSVEELAETTGVSAMRLNLYCDDELDEISLNEVSAILAALGCGSVADMFEEIPLKDFQPDTVDTTVLAEVAWDSVCPATTDGKHRWYKDLAASETVYQEFQCRACGRRVSLIL